MFEVVQIIKDDIYVTFFGTSLLFDCMSVVLVLDSCKRNICAAFAPLISRVISHFSCRIYPIKDVPVESVALTRWLYQRFVEKEELLAHFYETGKIFFICSRCVNLIF